MTLKAAIAALLLSAALAPAADAQPAGRLIGFHTPWDPQSAASLRDHGVALNVVAPVWLTVTGADHALADLPDAAGHEAVKALAPRLRVWPVLQNARLGVWDGANTAALLSDRAASAALLDQLEQRLEDQGASGLVVDFEALPAQAQPDLRRFLKDAQARGRRRGWTVAVAAPVGDPAWSLAELAQAVDAVIVMAYDEHWQTGPAGPIAGRDWFRAAVAQAATQIPRGKMIVGLATYGYDWPENGVAKVASALQAQALAARYGPLQDDAVSGEQRLAYVEDGVKHDLWIVPPAATRAQAQIARSLGARDVALWRLGTEAASLWAPPFGAAPAAGRR